MTKALQQSRCVLCDWMKKPARETSGRLAGPALPLPRHAMPRQVTPCQARPYLPRLVALHA